VNESNNKNIRWVVVLGIVLPLGLLWLWVRQVPIIKRETAPPTPLSALAVGTAPSPIPSATSETTQLQKPGGPYVSSDPRWAIVHEKDKLDHNWEWRMPIDFYGQVVDENDRAIPEAKVDFSWTDLSSAGTSTATTSSGLDGIFSLRGKTGRYLQVDVSKPGYYKIRNERLRSFDYAAFWERNYHQPDPAQPVTFHLRAKGRPEVSSSGESTPIAPADGTPVLVDLLDRGRVSANGQIEFAAVTNTEKYPPRTFDWRATITVRDGGLLEHNLEFPFEAPMEGYTPQVVFEMPANYPGWKRSIEKTYFIRFGTPAKYGRLQIRLNGASQKVFLRYTVNPTGSRNLEGRTDGEFAMP
jgi:hypothetical protein